MQPQTQEFQDQFVLVQGRPFPKDPLSYFQQTKTTRIFLTITDKPSVWQTDLSLGERLFGDVVVCPYTTNLEEHMAAYQLTKDVLTQRSRYPGVKENPTLEQLAKTWILPKKVHMGPEVSTLLVSNDKAVEDFLQNIYTLVNLKEEQRIHVLKVELANGQERQLLYKLLDAGLRPSLLLVKWSHDLDDHVPTAHCAGHIRNVGYSFMMLEGAYALYMFTDQSMYDICSMKEVGLTNPFMDSVLESVRLSTMPREQPEAPEPTPDV